MHDFSSIASLSAHTPSSMNMECEAIDSLSIHLHKKKPGKQLVSAYAWSF